MAYKKLSILIIEDNPADRRFIEEILKDSKDVFFYIQTENTLSGGISRINKDINVILLDLNLPDSNSIETLKKIIDYNIPVIVLSGINDIDLANQSIKYGAQDYLVKGTFDYNLLIRSINYSIERFQINQKIVENEENLKIIIENNADSILLIDKEGVILYANRQAEIIYNKKRDKLIGSFFGNIDPEKVQMIDIAGENNNVIFAEANASEITWKNKKVYLLTLRDISPHIHLQKLLQDSKLEIIKQKDLIRNYLDIAGVIILILDKNGTVTLINKKGCDTLEFEEKDIIGKNWFDHFTPDYLKEEVKKIHEKNILKAKYFEEYYENAVITKNDNIRQIEWHNSILMNNKNEIYGILCSGVDITERKQREARELLVKEALSILNKTNDIENAARNILQVIKKNINIDSAAIRLRDGDDFPYYETAGFPEKFIEKERSLCAKDQLGNIKYDINGKPILECMCGNILMSRTDLSKPFFTKDGSFWTNSTTQFLKSTTETERMSQIRNGCNSIGYESVALIPLKSNKEIIGLLQLNNYQADFFTLEMIQFFEGLGNSIGIALSHKATVNALTDSEKKYRSLFENMLNGYSYCRMIFKNDEPDDFIFLDVNKSFETLTGLKNVIGKKVSDIIPGIKELDPELFKLYSRVALTGKSENTEIYLKSLNMWFSVSVFSIEKGFFVSVFNVITDRKNAEEEIKFKNTILTTQQEASIDGILAVDVNGKIISYNKRFIEIWDIPHDIMESKSDELAIQTIINKIDDPEKFLEKLDYLYTHKDEKSFEEINLLNGTVLERYSAPMNGYDGKHYGRIWFFRDITERKKTERFLIESEKRNEIAQLSAGIAHEFNNILAIIKSAAQLLIYKHDMEKIKLDDHIYNELKSIDKQTKRGADIVSNLMLLSTPDKVMKEYLFVEDIIEDVLKLQKKQFDIENIKIKTDFKKERKISINPSQFQQIFLNLTINARHAIQPKRGGEIFTATSYNKDEVIIIFSDTGIGIKEKIKKNIFSPFFTTKGAHAENDLGINGTGLGLSVTHSIIKEYNGSITVESEEGKGTKFIITIPLIQKNTIESTSEKNISAVNQNISKDINIMIIDDEEMITENISNILKLLGFNSSSVLTKSDEAGKLIKKCHYDLFFIDLFMPGIKGNDIFKKIMNEEKNKNSKIVIMSGLYNDDIKETLLSCPGCFFLKKPFDINQIIFLLYKILDKKK